MERELQKKFDELYDNEVPQSVKDFLKFQSGDKEFDSAQENNPEQSDTSANEKNSRRQKIFSPKAEAAVEAPAMEQTM